MCHKLFTVLFLLLLLTACRTEPDDGDELSGTGADPTATVVASPTPTAAATATATLTASPTATPTLIPTATHTPTATPRPSRTPTPQPTTAPENFFRSTAGGFELLAPAPWEIAGSDPAAFVTLVDPSIPIFVIVIGGFENEEAPFADVVEGWRQTLEADWEVPFVVESQGTLVHINDQLEARRATYIGSGGELRAQVYYGHRQNYGYAIAVMSQTAPDDASLADLFDSIDFFGRYLYGLEHAETLVLLGSDPIAEALDPARQTGSAAHYAGQIYSGLVRLSPELTVEGDLAESWETSADGTVYTFTLRAENAFADGTPLRAADVKYSWERAADPQTGSQTAATYLGDIVGVPEMLAGEASEIAGVRVIDDLTLEVTIDAPKPYFLAKLTYPTSYIIDALDVEAGGEEWMYYANVSGPYRVRDYYPEEAMILERNPGYHTAPQIPYVLYRFDQFGQPLSLFQAGAIDISGVYGENMALVSEPQHELHDYWHSTVTLCTSFLQFDNQRPPMDDIEVRRAFALAIDREALRTRLDRNEEVLAQSILPPGLPGHSDTGVAIGYDADEARAALASSSYAGELPPVVLSTRGRGYGDNPFDNALIEMWREVLGVEVTLEYLDPVDYTVAARRRQGQIVTWGWCADYPDPENFLDILFHSQSDFNLAAYTNSDVDSMLLEARTELDGARRLELYQEAERMLLEDLAVLPLWHSVDSVVVNPRIQGYRLMPMGAPIMHLLSIDAQAEALP